MKTSNPYLYFDGRCREAMRFYGAVFGAEPSFTPFSAMPPDMAAVAPPDQIMHSELHAPGLVLMAGDVSFDRPYHPGNAVTISLSCDSPDELDRLFTALGDGGTVDMPLYDAFWGDRIGLLTDRFGVGWMLSFR